MLITDFIEAPTMLALRKKMVQIQLTGGAEYTFMNIFVVQGRNGKEKFVAWYKREATRAELEKIIT